VTGIHSVLQDNSRLTLRGDELKLPNAVDVDTVLRLAPLRVVLDTQLRISVNAAILEKGAHTVVLTSQSSITRDATKVANLRAKGSHVSVETLPVDEAGRLCLVSLLDWLSERECNDVLLESGALLSGAFLKAGLIDELIVYQAPILLGSKARPMVDLALDKMADKKSLKVIDQRQLGDDQRIVVRFE